MRISLIATHFAEYAARLALALSRDHAVQLHLSRVEAETELPADVTAVLPAAVDVHLHPWPLRKAMLLHGAVFAWQIGRFGADIVHAQEAAPYTLWAINRLTRLPRRPFVLTVHDPKPHSGIDSTARRHHQWPIDRIRRAADAIIVHGEALVGDIVAEVPRLATRVFAVDHGALGALVPVPPEGSAPRFLFFGRIQEYKGLGILIEAVERLAGTGLAFTVVIAGRGPDLDRYRARIAALADHIEVDERYIPYGEIAALFAGCSAVVMPYLDATQSGVAAFALPAAKPVIASRVGSIPEIIHDGVDGLLVPPGDPGLLAAALRRLMLEPGLQGRLAAGAAATARTQLSWDRIAAKTLAVYKAARDPR